jgi:Protein of unknown function (DUF3617)
MPRSSDEGEPGWMARVDPFAPVDWRAARWVGRDQLGATVASAILSERLQTSSRRHRLNPATPASDSLIGREVMAVPRRIVTSGLCALALAGVARAEDIAPGLWELTLEASVESDPGFQPGPMSSNQCITTQGARDPGALLGPITGAGATGCSYSEQSYVGEEFRFTMQCSGTLELKTTGTVTFSATTLRGLMTTSSAIDGKTVQFKSVLVGHWLGEC